MSKFKIKVSAPIKLCKDISGAISVAKYGI